MGAAHHELALLKGLLFVLVTGAILFLVLRVGRRRVDSLKTRLADAAESTHDGFWTWDIPKDAILVTQGGNPDLGWGAAQSIADMKSWRAAVHPDDWPIIEETNRQLMNGEIESYSFDHRIATAHGDWVWYRVKGRVVAWTVDRTPMTVTGSYYNVDELKRGEWALRRANRALAALVQANRASSTADNRAVLFESLCGVLYETDDYPLVWIGAMGGPKRETVRPVAARGEVGPLLDAESVGPALASNGLGRCVQAMHTGEPHVIEDVRNEPESTPWREHMEALSVRSVVTIPITLDPKRGPAYLLQIGCREPDAFMTADSTTYAALAGDLAAALKGFETRDRYKLRLERALRGAVSALAASLEKRDPYTAGHQINVARLSAEIARGMGMAEDEIEGIRIGASMHDIGKIGVPAEILAKPGRLDDNEMALVRRHAEFGYDIVKSIDFGWPVANIVHQHHERCDGSGYPRGLKGDEIAPEAKIVAVADVIESMASHRPYRPALGWDVVRDELRAGRGSRYEAAVVDAAFAVIDRESAPADSGAASYPSFGTPVGDNRLVSSALR